MHSWLGLTMSCAALSLITDIGAAQTHPAPANPITAQTSLGYNPKTRCPDLRIADEGTIAVVVFWLPSTGTPSQISIKSTSGSNALDSAAISCVSRLRFAAATRLGDGEPIDSWQQIAFRWANQGNANESRAMPPQPPAGGARAAEPVAAAAGQSATNAAAGDAGGQADSVVVHVCADEAGRLEKEPTIVRSSGKASLDQAAARIAASGSTYYRPDTSSNEPPVSGCVQLSIKFERK